MAEEKGNDNREGPKLEIEPFFILSSFLLRGGGGKNVSLRAFVVCAYKGHKQEVGGGLTPASLNLWQRTTTKRVKRKRDQSVP